MHKLARITCSSILTQLYAITAIDVEGLVALVNLPDGRIEDKPIRAEALRGPTVRALVELVALNRILVLAVLRRTLEALRVCKR